MTDQRNPKRMPQSSGTRQPNQPPPRGEQQPRSGEDAADQRSPDRSANDARPPTRSSTGPRSLTPFAASERPPSKSPVADRSPADQAADPYPQRRPQPRQPTLNLPPTQPPIPPTMPPKGATNGVSKPPSRIPFWLGFAISFLFLCVASLGILLLSTGVDTFNLASLQGGEAAWTPPELIPTPTQDPAQAGDISASSAGDGQYGTGSIVRNVTSTNVRIRQTPGNLSKPDGDVIAGIPAGDRAEVIGGPATVDGLTWWLVRYSAGNGQVIEGWSAEVTPSGVRILGPDQ